MKSLIDPKREASAEVLAHLLTREHVIPGQRADLTRFVRAHTSIATDAELADALWSMEILLVAAAHDLLLPRPLFEQSHALTLEVLTRLVIEVALAVVTGEPTLAPLLPAIPPPTPIRPRTHPGDDHDRHDHDSPLHRPDDRLRHHQARAGESRP